MWVWAAIENVPCVWVKDACQSTVIGTYKSHRIAPEGLTREGVARAELDIVVIAV